MKTGCSARRLAARSASAILALGVAVLAAGAGCTGDPSTSPAGEEPIVRDSAGIEIVENRAPRYAPGTWLVAADEVEVLCSGAGPAGDERVFRVRDVVPLDRGGVAAWAGGQSLVLHCRDGQVAAAHGGRGEGPGEFATFVEALVHVPGDSVAVLGQAKATVLDPLSGGFREFPLGRAGGGEVTRFMRQSEVLAGVASIEGEGNVIMVEDVADILVLDRADPGRVLHRYRRVPWALGIRSDMVAMALWGPLVPMVLARDRYLWAVVGDTEGWGGEGEIREFRPDGLARIVRSPIPVVEADAELEAWGEARALGALVDANPTAPEDLLRQIVDGNRLEGPPRAQAILALRVAPGGELWARIPEAEPRSDPRRWRVFSREGAWLTDVELPRDMSLRAVRDDALYAVHTDELELESVIRVPLRGR